MESVHAPWDVLIPVDSAVVMTTYVQDRFAASNEFAKVSRVATSLLIGGASGVPNQ